MRSPFFLTGDRREGVAQCTRFDSSLKREGGKGEAGMFGCAGECILGSSSCTQQIGAKTDCTALCFPPLGIVMGLCSF